MSCDPFQDFSLLKATCKEASELALSFWGRPIAKERKPDGSTVTEADKAVDALFASRLKAQRHGYGWLSEESPEHEARLSARHVWIVDPIDGTRGFVQGSDDWTVAAALVEDGAVVLAAVSNPIRDEFFEARAGHGAFRNGERIHASGRDKLAGAKFSVPGAISKRLASRAGWPEVTAIGVNSSLYRFALVAEGEADATFAIFPKWEWDVAPGALLVSEAGGLVSDMNGSPLAFNTQGAKVHGFVAAAPKLHQMVLDRLAAD